MGLAFGTFSRSQLGRLRHFSAQRSAHSIISTGTSARDLLSAANIVSCRNSEPNGYASLNIGLDAAAEQQHADFEGVVTVGSTPLSVMTQGEEEMAT